MYIYGRDIVLRRQSSAAAWTKNNVQLFYIDLVSRGYMKPLGGLPATCKRPTNGVQQTGRN